MHRFISSLIFGCIAANVLPAYALPGDSVIEVRDQLSSSALFEGIRLDSDSSGQFSGGIGDLHSTAWVNRFNRTFRFSMTFDYSLSTNESFVFLGSASSDEISREEKSSHLFIADIWGDSVQRDFQRSKFIFDRSARCSDGRASIKIYQGDDYYYRVLSRGFSEEFTSFQIGSLSFLPIALRDTSRDLNRSVNNLCRYGDYLIRE